MSTINWDPNLTIAPWLHGEEPSVHNSSADPKMQVPFDVAICKALLRLFRDPGGVVEVGCGKHSKMLSALYEAGGHTTYGYDLNPVDNYAQVEVMDLRKPTHCFDSQSYLLCTHTLAYLTVPEIVRALKFMFDAFTDTAFLYTPDSTMQMCYDPACITFVDAEWLAWACREIGGYAFVLNFYKDPNTGYGPSVCWFKDKSSWVRAVGTMSEIKLAIGDPRFSITLA
jgi:hypothetical protein